MAEATADLSVLSKGIETLESMAGRKELSPGTRVDALYYQGLSDYLRRIRDGYQEGKFLVMHNAMAPVELFYAMGAVPVDLEYCGTILAQILSAQQEGFNVAKAFGLPPEVCSTYHMIAASIIQGWLPKPNAVIWMKAGCDNSAHCGQWVSKLTGAPGFFIDKPYRQTKREVDYFVEELAAAAAFLEEQTRRKMDWGRLAEVMQYSVDICQLHLQIRELRKLDPPPMRSRRKLQMLALSRLCTGSPEGVNFYRAVLEECQERMSTPLRPTRFRLLSLFRAPNYAHKIYDWMENEHGAYVVMEANHEFRGTVEVDAGNPLRSLARRIFIQPGDVVYEGPVAENYLRWAVSDAKEFRADGGLFFALRQCRQGVGVIRLLKDTLSRECGIPMVVVDCDLVDPSVAPMEQLKEKLEEYFEMLAG